MHSTQVTDTSPQDQDTQASVEPGDWDLCAITGSQQPSGDAGQLSSQGSIYFVKYRQHPALALYAVTKAAQLKLIQNIAPQLAPYGVTVNNIAPGAVDTPRNREALADPAFAENLARGIPCGYIAQPQDIAPSILFLCSEESRYITGADLAIDGGMHLL